MSCNTGVAHGSLGLNRYTTVIAMSGFMHINDFDC